MTNIIEKGKQYDDGSRKKMGIDDYLVFDRDKNEIRMEIPMDHILTPEKNKKLLERKE